MNKAPFGAGESRYESIVFPARLLKYSLAHAQKLGLAAVKQGHRLTGGIDIEDLDLPEACGDRISFLHITVNGAVYLEGNDRRTIDRAYR